MRCTVVTLISGAAFSLCALAHPSPSQPAAISTPLTKRYIPGTCGVHVIQYRKNEGPTGSDGSTDEDRLDVSLIDNIQDPIGGVTLLSAPGGVYQDIDSQLPDVFEVMVGGTDQQPVNFMYSGQSWTSADGQCSVGGYNSGSRQMDCSFAC